MLETVFQSQLCVVVLKLLLAVILSGIIGMERGLEKQAAGFRTHIMVCVGAALVMMTNQYIFEYVSTNTDVARLGAQVITGVGFLGAGTIIFTGRQKVKGLTTAAGLWASACVGLAIGIGFYSGAITAAVMIFLVHTVFQKLEKRLYRKSPLINLYIEARSMESFGSIMFSMQNLGVEIVETRLSSHAPAVTGCVAFFMVVKMKNREDKREMVRRFRKLDGVVFIEEA